MNNPRHPKSFYHLSVFAIMLTCFFCGYFAAAGNSNTPPAVLSYSQAQAVTFPAQHTWTFTEKDVREILIQYLKSIGTNVPVGPSKLNGIESHFDYANSPRLELVVLGEGQPDRKPVTQK